MLKPEFRVIGFDDGPFTRKSKRVMVIGVVFRGGKFLEGVLRTYVKVDGLDATEKIAKLLNSSRHKQQLKLIMLDGITMGGFNLIDIKELNKLTYLPVIVINRKKPNLKEVKKALQKFEDFETRWKIVKNAGKIKKMITIKGKELYYQHVGISEEEAEEAINLTISRSDIPEPLRVAHIIVSGVVRGESYGRA